MENTMTNTDIKVIGVAGGTASGKTTIVNIIQEHFRDNLAILSHDSYYKAHHEMTYEERCLLNYDHPDSFETDMMVDHLRALKQGQAVDIPVYDYTIHNRSQNIEHIEPRKVIIVEGILILDHAALRDEMDLKIFVDTDADERLMRRLRRDMVERARSVDSVLSQYSTTVKPMHEAYVEPSKRYADIIIPRGGQNKSAIDLLLNHIERLLK